jgi:hypothetical protein
LLKNPDLMKAMSAAGKGPAQDSEG